MTLLDTSLLSVPVEPWDPTPENILDVADFAMRVVLRSRFSFEDRQDATQAAAVEIWHALQRRGNRGRGYAFCVGRYALYDWLREHCKTTQECNLEPLEWMLSSAEPEQDAPDLDVARVREYGEFTDREITYLQYRTRGYSTRAIMQEMGVSDDVIYKCRKKLLPRLTQLASEARAAL